MATIEQRHTRPTDWQTGQDVIVATQACIVKCPKLPKCPLRWHSTIDQPTLRSCRHLTDSHDYFSCRNNSPGYHYGSRTVVSVVDWRRITSLGYRLVSEVTAGIYPYPSISLSCYLTPTTSDLYTIAVDPVAVICRKVSDMLRGVSGF